MSDNVKKSYIITGAWFIGFMLFTLLVMFVDVKAVGPEGTGVGFSAVNKAIADAFPYRAAFYKISKYAGYLTIAIAACFAAYGVLMAVVRKSLKKVDRDIYVLAGLYVLVVIFYVLFDKVVINYRPVLEDGAIEASYPSTHTMLAICILMSAATEIGIRVKENRLRLAIKACLYLLMVIVILARFFSGVHWLTDFVGAALLSIALVRLFRTVCAQLCGDEWLSSKKNED
ncbi:MAG: phosphatase PAP2 family protein [Lachnospiraceae bacterium]|nr:phosphatase PAP2 family protein [Lachnospiraceae bacterium]